jgi:hypothetical protein
VSSVMRQELRRNLGECYTRRMNERDRRIFLERLSGRDVRAIADDHQLSRSQVHRVVAKVRDSGEVRAVVGVKAESVEGPFSASEIGDAVRAYAESLGIRKEAP